MASNVFPLQVDGFRPMDFRLTADKARSARADAEMSKTLMLWAQTSMQISLRGEMTAQRRHELMEAVGAIRKHPKLG